MNNKTRVLISLAATLALGVVTYVVATRVLDADEALWDEQPLEGTTKVEKLIVVNEK